MKNQYETNPLTLADEFRDLWNIVVRQDAYIQQQDVLMQLLLQQDSSRTQEIALIKQQLAVQRKEILDYKMRLGKLESRITNDEVETQRFH